jgi:N-acetylneuraminic acid mutarotase
LYLVAMTGLPPRWLLLPLAAGITAASAQELIKTDFLDDARNQHAATALADGRVLVTGGLTTGSALKSAEIYDPATSTWTTVASMTAYRRLHTATRMDDGRVLVAGGWDDYNIPAGTEIFNPASGTWSSAGSLVNKRHGHTATLLANGRVMVIGGTHTQDGSGTTYPTQVEVYYPTTGAWQNGPALPGGRAFHTATRLANGKVLVTGGRGTSSHFASCVLYDPAVFPAAWVATGTLKAARAYHTANLLPNGKVLVTGGHNGSTYLTTTELYDPATGTWAYSGAMGSARKSHTATVLPDGRVLLAGGSTTATTFAAAAEFYDPATGTCSPGPTHYQRRELHTATLLPAGEVLFAGGSQLGITSTAELYDTPTVTTSAVSQLTPTSARLGANVTVEGSAPVTARGIVFSPVATNADPRLGGTGVTALTATGTTDSFSANATGLTPGTAYRFRGYATNGVGTGYSAAGNFTTPTEIEAWRTRWYGSSADAGDAADDADPHHTGVANLLVFALLGPDQDPSEARLSQLPQPALSEDGFGYAFMPPAGTGPLTYGAETSETLEAESWQAVPDTGSAGVRRFVVAVGASPRHFLRLKVTRP